jgi:hypothetical protein
VFDRGCVDLGERRNGEVRRIPLLGSPMNKLLRSAFLTQVLGATMSNTTPTTIRATPRMCIGPRISFQSSNPKRTEPAVPSPYHMAYATPSGMYLRLWAKK